MRTKEEARKSKESHTLKDQDGPIRGGPAEGSTSQRRSEQQGYAKNTWELYQSSFASPEGERTPKNDLELLEFMLSFPDSVERVLDSTGKGPWWSGIDVSAYKPAARYYITEQLITTWGSNLPILKTIWSKNLEEITSHKQGAAVAMSVAIQRMINHTPGHIALEERYNKCLAELDAGYKTFVTALDRRDASLTMHSFTDSIFRTLSSFDWGHQWLDIEMDKAFSPLGHWLSKRLKGHKFLAQILWKTRQDACTDIASGTMAKEWYTARGRLLLLARTQIVYGPPQVSTPKGLTGPTSSDTTSTKEKSADNDSTHQKPMLYHMRGEAPTTRVEATYVNGTTPNASRTKARVKFDTFELIVTVYGSDLEREDKSSTVPFIPKALVSGILARNDPHEGETPWKLIKVQQSRIPMAGRLSWSQDTSETDQPFIRPRLSMSVFSPERRVSELQFIADLGSDLIAHVGSAEVLTDVKEVNGIVALANSTRVPYYQKGSLLVLIGGEVTKIEGILVLPGADKDTLVLGYAGMVQLADKLGDKSGYIGVSKPGDLSLSGVVINKPVLPGGHKTQGGDPHHQSTEKRGPMTILQRPRMQPPRNADQERRQLQQALAESAAAAKAERKAQKNAKKKDRKQRAANRHAEASKAKTEASQLKSEVTAAPRGAPTADKQDRATAVRGLSIPVIGMVPGKTIQRPSKPQPYQQAQPVQQQQQTQQQVQQQQRAQQQVQQQQRVQQQQQVPPQQQQGQLQQQKQQPQAPEQMQQRVQQQQGPPAATQGESGTPPPQQRSLEQARPPQQLEQQGGPRQPQQGQPPHNQDQRPGTLPPQHGAPIRGHMQASGNAGWQQQPQQDTRGHGTGQVMGGYYYYPVHGTYPGWWPAMPAGYSTGQGGHPWPPPPQPWDFRMQHPVTGATGSFPRL
jgi:hypothetical protein